MSRSVKPDYDRMFKVAKLSATIKLTDEQLFWFMGEEDSRYARKFEEWTVASTNMDWAKYHRAKAGLLALLNYEGAGGLSEVEIDIPRPQRHTRYTETHEEWLARCHTLQAERKAA